MGVLIGLWFYAPSLSAQNDTLKVLFIGNSHTYTNDLPQLFVDLSLSGGRPAVKDMNAIPDYTLLQHTTNPTTLELISRGTWDYVVLQDQSLYPVIDYFRYGSMYSSVIFLDSLITMLGQHTAIYMTWGRPHGGQWCQGDYCSINFENYFQMQDSVSASCRMIADSISALLLPAGDAWAVARSRDSTVDLWQSDEVHATLKGSYLAACVFYATFYRASPVGLSFTAGLLPQDALFLQQAADSTVLAIGDETPNRPKSYAIYQNFPNPFNSETNIAFELPHEEFVRLAIYDVGGRLVRRLEDGRLTTGRHEINWDSKDENGKSVSSGVYFSILDAGHTNQAIKLLLLK